MSTIGGYIEFELPRGREYHASGLALNSGRTALRHILSVRKYSAIHVPYYCCSAVWQAVIESGCECKYYNINEDFSPNLDRQVIKCKEAVLIVNYFGLLDNAVQAFATKGIPVIVDNSQAFFAIPLANCDTFYSARKYFGVPDGAYCYLEGASGRDSILNYEQADSWNRCAHLLRRIDNSPEDGYQAYLRNERWISNARMLQMSRLTQRIMQSIDYDGLRAVRRNNAAVLSQCLNHIQEDIFMQNINWTQTDPLAYPLLVRHEGLQSQLIDRGVFVPCYWQEVIDRVHKRSREFDLVRHLLPLPIDQRYCQNDMEHIAAIILSLLSK